MADEPTGTVNDGDPNGISTTDPAEPTPTGEQGEDQARSQQQEAYIAKLKGEYGGLVQRYDKLAEQVVEMQGRLGEHRDILARREEPAETPQANPWELDPKVREDFQNSPDKIVDFVRDRDAEKDRKIDALVQQMSSLLQERDKFWDKRLRESDPEIKAWAPAIAELRKDAALSDLPDEKLVAIAKRANMKPAYEFSGGPSPRPAAAAPRSKVDEKATFARFMEIYGDEARAKKATENLVKKQQGGAV